MPVAKTKTKAQIHAVVGSDESEVKRAARSLAAELTPADNGEFGVEVIDGCADNSEQAATRVHQTIEALLTFPFFGGEKLVWLKNVNFLGDNVIGRSQAVLEALEKLTATLAGGIPESTKLLLSAVDVDKRRTFYKGLLKVAKVEIFDRVDLSKAGWEQQAAPIVEQLARDRGLQMDGEALELFTLFTGGDRRVIENELEKLSILLGPEGGSVPAQRIRETVPMSRAGGVFELSNAIASRDLLRALDLLEQLLFQGETAIGMLIVAIIPTVRNLLLVKDLMLRHKIQRPAQAFFFGKSLDRLSEEALAHLPRKKDGTLNAFPLGIAAQHAHRYEISELRAGLAACLAANGQLVTSTLEAKVTLTQLLVRVMAKTDRR